MEGREGWLEFFCGHLRELGSMVLWAGGCGVGRSGPAEEWGVSLGQRLRGGGFFLPCLPVSDPRAAVGNIYLCGFCNSFLAVACREDTVVPEVPAPCVVTGQWVRVADFPPPLSLSIHTSRCCWDWPTRRGPSKPCL